MADPLLFPDNAAAKMRDLEQRIRTLESSNRLLSSAIKDGALKVYDSAGILQIVLGRQADGNYGILVGASQTVPALEVNNVDGMTQPNQAVVFADPSNTQNVTGTTTLRFIGRMTAVSHKGLRISTRVDVPAGSAGTIMIRSTWTSGQADTSTRTLTGPGINFNTFFWLHGAPIGSTIETQTVLFSIHVVLTSGAGPLVASEPDYAFLVGPEHCSSNGDYVS